MASVQSDKYDGRYLRLTVVEESYSIADNTSTVRWTLESIGGNTTYYSIYNCSVVVNGQTVYNSGNTGWNTYRFPAAKGSTTGTILVKHKADGTADPIGFTLHGRVYYSGDNNRSGTCPLSTIPRYANPWQSVNETGDNYIKINWGADASCDSLQYSINGGATWINISGYPVYTIYGLSPNTTYNIATRVRRQDSQLWSNTSVMSVKTLTSPYTSALSDFNIGSSLSCTIYNPKERSLALKLLTSDGIEILSRTTSINGTYTFVLTETENTALYNAIPNNPSGTFRISVYCSELGTTNYSNSYVGWKTFYAVESKCSPEIEISAVDCNAKSLKLTGDANTLIKYVSNVLTEITASGKKGASIKNILIQSIDGQNVSFTASSQTVTKSTVFNSVEGAVFSCAVVDSRGFTNSTNITLNIIDYVKLTLNVDVYRPSPTNGYVAVKFNGNYFNKNFGKEDNTLTLKYHYKEHATDIYGEWIELNPTKRDNTYSNGYTEITLGTNFDYQKSYDFEFVVLDKIYDDKSISVFKTVLDGQTIYDWGKDDFNINGKLNIFEVSIIRHIANILWPVNSIYTSLTKSIPEYLAGEWALLDTIINGSQNYYIYKRISENEKLYYSNVEVLFNGEEIYIENTLLKGDDVL